MNTKEWVYTHIKLLPTPCGVIAITDESGKNVKFSVRDNPYRPDYHLFYGTENQEIVNTDTNYLISVDTSILVLGQIYRIHLTGSELHLGDSDEHTESVCGTSNGYSISIGTFDPNDDEKMSQAEDYSKKQGYLARRTIVEPQEYDKSRFVKYDVEMLADYSGFAFHLLERTIDKIVFPVAWIENKHEDADEYEGAVGFWTT